MKTGWIFYVGLMLLILSVVAFWLGDNIDDFYTAIGGYILGFTILSRILLLMGEIIKSYKNRNKYKGM